MLLYYNAAYSLLPFYRSRFCSNVFVVDFVYTLTKMYIYSRTLERMHEHSYNERERERQLNINLALYVG